MSEIYCLSIPDGSSVSIADDAELAEKLRTLPSLPNGAVLMLSKGERDYIKAKRWNGLWQIHKRRGGFWTMQTFSSAFSTSWSERNCREPFNIRNMFFSKSDTLFDDEQMVSLFLAHFNGQKYPYPYLGA